MSTHQKLVRMLLVPLLWFVVDVRSVSASFIEQTVDPNPIDVMCGTKKAGTLKIENYYKQENYQRKGTTWSGAYLEAIFTEDPDFCPGDDYIGNLRWIQAITGGTNTKGTPPYLDPFERDDGLPFYWTESENLSKDGENGTRLSDAPGSAITEPDNSITFEAGLFCVDFTSNEMTFLKGFSWGYSRTDGDGDGQRDDVTLNPFSWLLGGISDKMKGRIEGWDGSNTHPYAGDGTADGWKVVADCKCGCAPEPASFWIFLIGAACCGVVYVGRSRRRLSVAA